MARPKKPRANPLTDLYVGVIGLTANQIVAYNLAQARQWKNWTQEQAAEAIEPYLGVRWSKASVSQAERSVDGRFVRNFSADEIAAFAQAFEMPITWFFMPPPPNVIGGTVMLVDREGTNLEPLAGLVDLVFGTELTQGLLTMRLEGFLQNSLPGVLTKSQARITGLVQHRLGALLRDSFRSLASSKTQLRAIANQIEDLENAAKQVVAKETGVSAREFKMRARDTSEEEGS